VKDRIGIDRDDIWGADWSIHNAGYGARHLRDAVGDAHGQGRDLSGRRKRLRRDSRDRGGDGGKGAHGREYAGDRLALQKKVAY
jgi:hypothetical protein